MNVQFGFLGSRTIVRATLRAASSSIEATTTATYRRNARTIVWSDAADSRAVFEENPSMRLRDRRGSRGAVVEVWDESALDGSHHGVVVSLSASAPELSGRVRVAFEAELGGENDVEAYLVGISVHDDARGIPRVTLGGPLAKGDPRDAINRDSVAYFHGGHLGRDYAIRFTMAGGLAADHVQRDASLSIVSAAAPSGIVVSCDAAPGETLADVRASARDMAASVRRG